MTSPSTVLVVLMAGDVNTVLQLDATLRAIHDGMSGPSSPGPHDVYCFYYRYSQSSNAIQSAYFRLEPGSLQFGTDGLLSQFPPVGAVTASALLTDDFAAFLEFVDVDPAATAPIRMILGAHGYAALGFDPDSTWNRIVFAMQLVFSELNPELNQMSWSSRTRYLYDKLFQTGAPVGGLTTRLGQNRPDLLLDELRDLLSVLPSHRFQTLILHTCESSCIETILALNLAAHHIACASLLQAWMSFEDWFGVLSDPIANESTITAACFAGLVDPANDPNAKGVFSSHRTTDLASVIAALNAVGDFFDALAPADRSGFLTAVKQARDNSLYSHAVDLDRFAVSLASQGAIPLTLRDSLRSAISGLQVQAPQDTIGFFGDYQGIGVFLPARNSTAYSVTDLPGEFQTQAASWCRFVNAWQTSSP